MISVYVRYLLDQAVYEQDESGYVVAQVPGYQGFFSQWTTYESARANLKDAIEWVITHKIAAGDRSISADIQSFISTQDYAQARATFA